MKSIIKKILTGILLGLLFSAVAHAQNNASEQSDSVPLSLNAALSSLVSSNFTEKSAAIDSLVKTGGPRIVTVLQRMYDGELYYRKQDKRVVFAETQADEYLIIDALTGESLGTVGKRKIRKISINNTLRTKLRNEMALLRLSSNHPPTRIAALRELYTTLDNDNVTLLRDMLAKESDSEVRAAVNIGIALVDINATDRQVRLAAIALLAESLDTEAKNRLAELTKMDDQGHYLEADTVVRKAAVKAINRINERNEFFQFIETVFFGLSLGSVLLLIAIGLAITFGVMGVINMAHGELMMIGAYTTYVVQLLMPNAIDYSLFVAVPLAFFISGLFGIAIERGVIRHLYGRPLETLLATFGISLILQQLVRTVFSPLNRSVATPSWMSGSLEINGALSLTYNRLYIIVFSLIVFAALLLILKKTSLGLKVRAVSQNRAMAKAMGVRSGWVDAMTFGLGSGVAGVAGVALSQLTNVGPNLGQAYIIDSFMVVVFGGVGNLWGTLVGGMSLGVVNKFLEPWSGAVLAKILVLIAIILFIQKRPRGLFPQKGRAVEN